MPTKRNTKLHAVKQSPDELKTQLRRHRLRVFRGVLIILAIILAVIVGVFLYLTFKTYTAYEVTDTIEREDTAATKFETYAAGMLKYSNDGASYLNLDNDMIWNQTYEMQEPSVKIEGSYVAVGDIGGTTLYILNEEGTQGNIVTTMPICAFDVATQGTIAVLLQSENSYYLKLYDKGGSELASGELHEKTSGYPLSLALAPDAKKLAVSMMTVAGGSVGTTLNFYNFGSVGQNEQDNIVATYTYENMLIPEMVYTSADLLVAFGDSQIQIYSGAQKPVLDVTVDLEYEVQSVFYNDTYFGICYNNEDDDNTRQISVYDSKGSEVLSEMFDMDYETIELLSNDEICIRNNHNLLIYNMFGVEKFRYEFDAALYEVIPQYAGIYYTFVEEDKTEKVRLK